MHVRLSGHKPPERLEKEKKGGKQRIDYMHHGEIPPRKRRGDINQSMK